MDQTPQATEMTNADRAHLGTERSPALLGTVRGRPFHEVKSISELPKSEYTLWQLIWSDYCAQYGYKHESPNKRALMFLPRMITNASLHATTLIRLCGETPVWTWWFWRRLIMILHGCEVLDSTRFGPGLRCPHPVGIVMGFLQGGQNVVLQSNVTISPIRTNWRTGLHPGLVQIGDGVVLFPGSVIAGPIAVGDGAMVGANTLVTNDVPANHIATSRGTRPLKEAERYSPQVAG